LHLSFFYRYDRLGNKSTNEILLKTKDWILFILLGTIWSASFLWIKIAIREIGPFTVVAFRVLFGMLFAGAITLYLRSKWPRDAMTWGVFALLGVTSIALPFSLITWGELSIDSAVASILNATVPLFTIIIAHLFLKDDRVTMPRVFGLLVGFSGVVILLSKDLRAGSHNSVIGQAAVILASFFYAASSVYARIKTVHVPSLVRGAAPLLSATLVMWMIAPVAENPLNIPSIPLTWVALLWLGVLGSGLALILWYYLLHEIGPTRTTLVTYIFPLGGVILGVVFLDEPLSWQLLVGAALIIVSIAVVNWKPRQRTTGERR
jgi:drug/metabolite transporter (DMT)-like permease